ncbi:MAG: glycosyltransferase family 9 protein [Verrucomicrobia bacterium]|nr:glycosyltransferase family 9 protein [Verrucomicrobiota bacterium]
MNDVRNILLLRLKSIGDVVLALPAVNLVRDNFPQARISFLTSKENIAMVSGCAAVDEIIALDRAAYRRKDFKAICAGTFELVRRLRRERFSLAVDFQGYGETALLTWLTRAPRRWGSVYRRGRRWAYTQGVTRAANLHPVEWNRRLLIECGLKPMPARNEFVLPEAEIQSARQFLAAHGCDSAQPVLYLQPFTSSPQKNWPMEHYLALANHWRARGVQVMFGGGPADLAALEPARRAGFVVAAGVPRLTDAGLMKLSTLIVGGDTGFLHLAVALGQRVLMLMTLSGEGSAIPFGHPDWVVTPRSESPVAAIGLEKVVRASAEAFLVKS